MASITIKKAVNSSVPYAVLTVSQGAQSIPNNTTTVSYSLVLYRPSSVSSSTNKKYSITINGSTVKSGTYAIGGSGTKTIASGSVTVSHGSDGKKTLSFGASVEFGITWSGTKITTVSNSGSMTLTQIPRVSDLSINKTSIPADGASTVTATAAKKSSAFTDTLTVKLGSYSKDITSGTAFTIPKTWINAITGTSAVATVTVTTKSGTTVIGSKSLELTVTVPEDVKPTVNSISVAEAVSSVTSAFGNRFVKTLSQLNVSINASGIYGSTIKSYATTLDGVNYVGQAFNSNALNKAGSLEIKTTVTDSRGRKATLSKTIDVVDYTPPTITAMTYYPCDSAGKENSSGTYTKVLISGKVASVDAQNIKTLLLKYKATSGETYTVRSLTVPNWTFNVETIIAGTDPSVTYEYVAELTDKIGTTSYAISTGVPVISRLAGGKGVRFFGECFQEGFMVGNIDYTITDAEYAELLKLLGGARVIDWLLPVGSVRAFVTGVDPNKIYRSQKWERFAKGQTLVGINESDTDFGAVGKTGGKKTHTLTTTEMPSHSHNISTDSNYVLGTTGALTRHTVASGSGQTNMLKSADAAVSRMWKGTQYSGGSAAHNNLQPYTTVYYWKRTA